MVDPLAFLGVSLLVIVTPGQDTALTIRNTVLGGRRGGLSTAAGVVAGQLCWALATSLGLAAVLLAWQPAVFFTSLLPQFAQGPDPSVPALLLPGVVFAGLTLGWLSGYAVAVVRAGDVLRRPRIRRALDAIMGTALVVLGVRGVADAR